MIEIVNLSLSGQTEYTIPHDTAAIAFHAMGGNVQLRHLPAGSPWTLMTGQKESIDTRSLAGQKLYLTGADGTILEIRILKGLLA